MTDQQVNQYLHQLFSKIDLPALSTEDQKKVDRGLINFIFDKIDRKKFRRKQLGEASKTTIKQKIKLSVDSSQPIYFVFPFGGYKHFWNQSHPEPDWAELFNLRYLVDYLLPILSAYKPGVIVEYISEDLIVGRMNNYPQKSLDAYSATFQKIIEWYYSRVPSNLQLKFFRESDRFSQAEIIKKVESVLPQKLAAFAHLSDDAKAAELHRSDRSIFWQGDQDWTSLSETEKQQKIIESRQLEQAFYDSEAQPDFLDDYLFGGNHICLMNSFGTTKDNLADDLTIGSTYSSLVDFWIGRGILEDHQDRLSPRIVSHTQYDSIKPLLTSVKVNPEIFPLKNYASIDIMCYNSSK